MRLGVSTEKAAKFDLSFEQTVVLSGKLLLLLEATHCKRRPKDQN